MLSDSSFNAMLRSWRKARLDTGNEALGYPKINILEKARMGSRRTGGMTDGQVTDAELFQIAVVALPKNIRRAFEACHLALIDEKKFIGAPHAIRAQALGVAKSTYWNRVKIGKRRVCERLEEFLDDLDVSE